MTQGIACPNCAQLNPPGSSECARCRQSLGHEVRQEWEVASNWARTGAALVDALIGGVIVVVWFIGLRDTTAPGSGAGATLIPILGIYLLPAYRGISGLIWRATPGKLLFGLRVIGENGARLPAGRVLGREFVFAQFVWVAIAGVAWILFIVVASPLFGVFAFGGWGRCYSHCSGRFVS